MKVNKELEKKIEFFTFDLKDVKKEIKNDQEIFSQMYIELCQKFEKLKE